MSLKNLKLHTINFYLSLIAMLKILPIELTHTPVLTANKNFFLIITTMLYVRLLYLHVLQACIVEISNINLEFAFLIYFDKRRIALY